MLGQDNFHRPLERRAWRPGARRDPVVELGLGHLQETGEALAAALQVFALLEDAGAHFRPPGVLLVHGREQSKRRSRLLAVFFGRGGGCFVVFLFLRRGGGGGAGGGGGLVPGGAFFWGGE